MGARLGLLGGTFDPVHVGHLVVAQDVLEALRLERLLVVPAARPPHRETTFPAEDRFRWTRRAFRGDDRIEVLDLELERPGPSFTVDTLEELHRRRSPESLHCVIGVDQLEVIDSWRAPERIDRLSTIAVMTREGEDPERLRGEVSVDFRPVPVTRVDLSSSRVRRRLREGLTVRYLVPESVRPEVEERGRAAASPDRAGE